MRVLWGKASNVGCFSGHRGSSFRSRRVRFFNLDSWTVRREPGLCRAGARFSSIAFACLMGGRTRKRRGKSTPSSASHWMIRRKARAWIVFLIICGTPRSDSRQEEKKEEWKRTVEVLREENEGMICREIPSCGGRVYVSSWRLGHSINNSPRSRVTLGVSRLSHELSRSSTLFFVITEDPPIKPIV